MEQLMSYPWPGNVRELQNVLKNVVISENWNDVIKNFMNRKPNIDGPSGQQIPQNIGATMANEMYKVGHQNFKNLEDISLKKIKKKATDKVEKEVISYVLNRTFWNRTRAAKVLCISYKTLLYKISELNIEPNTSSYGGSI